MKAISFFTAATAVLGLLVSCQKEKGEIFNTGYELVPVTLTASLDVVGSKVTYNEVDKDYNYQLKPAWEDGVDKIIGFDEASPRNNYTFTVTDVDATTGEATLEGNAPANCNMHLIYLYGAAATSISDGSLAVDYTGQTGDKTMPAVMLADGTITNGTGSFTFHNAGAVIGIKAVNGVPNGSTISKITIIGENLSAATIVLNGGSLKLTATEKANDSIILEGLTGESVIDDNGTLNKPVFIAVPDGAIVSKVNVAKVGFNYSYSLPTPQTLNANKYAYVSQQVFTDLNNGHESVDLGLSVQWATCNIGAENPYEYGCYYQWAGTQDVTSLSISWDVCPYHSGSNEYENWIKYIPSDASTYWSGGGSPDNKTVLDPADDVARMKCGSAWRIPSKDEFLELIENTEQTWVENYQNTGVNGFIFTSTKSGYTDKYIFLPAGGRINNVGLDHKGNRIYYWTSSLGTTYFTPGSGYGVPCDACGLFSTDDKSVSFDSFGPRFNGRNVRPVLE